MSTMTTGRPSGDLEPFAAGNTNELAELNLGVRRRWPSLLLGAALGATAMLAIVLVAADDDGADGAADTVAPDLATSEVTMQDLVDEVEWLADLGYGEPIDVTATHEATVTGTSDAGTVLGRGHIAYELDNEPIPVFYGELPFWRDLGEGDDGPDVEQLETNLVALGYDPDMTVTIDNEFTSNTTLMVERWQADIGAAVTGELALGSVVVAPGPVAVNQAATVGTRLRVGSAVLSLSTRSRTRTVVGEATGEIAVVASKGAAIGHGDVLYEADGTVVQALTSVDSIAQLVLDEDTDPVTLESALAFAGYDPDDEMILDDEIDEATTAALERWQRDVGLSATGVADPSGYVVVDHGQEVVDTILGVGDRTTVPRPVLVLGAPTLSVVIPVALADQDDFAVGMNVEVELPDDSTVTGVVTDVGNVAASATPGEEPFIDVTVELTQPPDETLPASEITVMVAGESVTDVMVVATRALVTLAEGGFAVEKVLSDGSTVLVAVETGTFDDGVVEVASSQLEPGDQVVVPQ